MFPDKVERDPCWLSGHSLGAVCVHQQMQMQQSLKDFGWCHEHESAVNLHFDPNLLLAGWWLSKRLPDI